MKRFVFLSFCALIASCTPIKQAPQASKNEPAGKVTASLVSYTIVDLFRAVAKDDLPTFTDALESGVDPNLQLDLRDNAVVDISGLYTLQPMHILRYIFYRASSEAFVLELLKHGLNWDSPVGDKTTLLCACIDNIWRLQAGRKILDEIDLVHFNQTVVNDLVDANDLWTMRYLVSRGLDIRKITNASLLSTAISREYPDREMIGFLLLNGADPNKTRQICCGGGTTAPILDALDHDQLARDWIIPILLRNGAKLSESLIKECQVTPEQIELFQSYTR